MDLRERISEAMSKLSETEKMIVLSFMIDALIGRADDVKSEIRFIRSIPISKIDPSPDHPFYVNDDENMKDLARSIQTYGMLTPGTVRTKDDGRYELLSGHRRIRACQLLGLESFRCEVLDLNDEEATMFMIEANRQRPRLLPGEKGLAYRMKEKVLSNPIMDRDEKSIRLDAEDSIKVIHKLEHLEYLIPELLQMVDEDLIALSPAYQLSFLPVKYQKVIWDYIVYEQCTPSHSQTIRMRKLNEEGALTEDLIGEIMDELKPNQKERLILRNRDTLAEIPDHIPEYRREEYVAKALKLFKKIGR